MIALGLTFLLILFWGVLGYVILAVLDYQPNPVRNMLLAPAIGIATTVLPLFWINRLGVPVANFGLMLLVALLIMMVVLYYVVRPAAPFRSYLPFLGLLVLAVILTGQPMLKFNFDWLSFSNDDMANYVMRAHRVENHGFYDVPKVDELIEGRDYTQFYWFMDVIRSTRIGADLLLAWVISFTGLNGHQLFMPMMLAFHFALISASAGLCFASKQDALAALLVCLLLVLSPLTTLGTLYQLIAQVSGLALLAASAALVFRPLREGLPERSIARYGVLVGLVISALIVVYPEVSVLLGGAFIILLGAALILDRDWMLLRRFFYMLGAATITVIVLVNVYLPDFFVFLLSQANTGTASALGLFPSFFLPSGLAIVWGLEQIPVLGTESSLTILAAMILFIVTFIGAIILLRQKHPAAAIVIVQYALGIVLFMSVSDFGLFKLSMYIQPFLLGTLTLAWVYFLKNKHWAIQVGPLVLLALLGLKAQQSYVHSSYGMPGSFVEIPNASQLRINEEFAQIVENSSSPVILLDTPVIVMQKYQVLYTKGTPTAVVSHNSFSSLIVLKETIGLQRLFLPAAMDLNEQINAQNIDQEFDLHDDQRPDAVSRFTQITLGRPDPDATVDPLWIVTGQTQSLMNHHELAEYGTATLIPIPESELRNHLVFINSELGQHYYGFRDLDSRSFFQLEDDWILPEHFMLGVGRYLLFEVINPSPFVRLELELSVSLNSKGTKILPPAAAIGDERVALPMVGWGAARVFSEPFKVQHIGGFSYVMIDMGRDGEYPQKVARSGLASLYGTDILIDNRKLVGWSRDISLISDEEYASLTPPSAIQTFPDDLLLNRDLEYSGIYEDGWISNEAFLTLTARQNHTALNIEGFVPMLEDNKFSTDLEVMLDGDVVARETLSPGNFTIRIPFLEEAGRYRIDLRFSTGQILPGGDDRTVAGFISYIGFK
jgi:hypothetical protein